MELHSQITWGILKANSVKNKQREFGLATFYFFEQYLQFFLYVRLSKLIPVLQKRFKACFSTLFSIQSFRKKEVVKVHWSDDTAEE